MIDIDSISKKIALRIIAEEFSDEKQQQDDIEKDIKSQGLEASEKKEKSDLQDEGDDAPDEKIEPKPVPNKDGEEDDSGEFEVEAVEKQDIPDHPSLKDIESQINNLRAGRSLKDKEVSSQLSDYFEKLGQAEERSLFVFLSSLAAILTGGTSGEDAPRPETMGVDIGMKPKNKNPVAKNSRGNTPEVDKKGQQAPIIVGERSDTFAYKMKILEGYTAKDKHHCLNGRVVGFGSKACVQDLSRRVDDAAMTRDSCGSGTANRASLNGTLKYLRQKLRAAQKLQLVK
jgi:hypothetical protein